MGPRTPPRSIIEASAGVFSDAELARTMDATFDQFNWAEDEIGRAQRRHRQHRDVLHHCFGLLKPTHGLMSREFVYRSHCRELLDRVAGGSDTTVATAAEVALSLVHASLATPLNTVAFGLYVRMWKIAGFPALDALGSVEVHYEAIAASEIDDLENWTRTKLAVRDRTLTGIVCHGRHHDTTARCRFAHPTTRGAAA
ncbi:hypothetical protein IU510_20595 [Nocardia cyriacigeorgica]|uniref:hypothetical protein n=1 Tax=Nocardia cyriacigeorgica TaxID=135487 RepID=UPI0018937C64|nr:hypothetical protein [Nocardia cyriacigeorgica]MBF6100461.1 hypothetical protein [Nocardia cyriacigeorgica]MBF6320295.1 hypothetical protein [Nocardia cyriacigeorgica]MBF6346329.1 hypothetical protein [Nocardia cyriacigeorgica]MBF6534219.1 hypothetical protein [Nocardia cyriacigeorgica]